MSGFIASGNTDNFTIDNTWYPDIDANHLRNAQRLDGAVSNARLETAAINAILTVNKELTSFKAEHTEHADLAAVPADLINGESRLVLLYRRAVYALATAELTERYRGFDSTNDGHENADESEPVIDDLRRDARWAINDILGISRSTVELI